MIYAKALFYEIVDRPARSALGRLGRRCVRTMNHSLHKDLRPMTRENSAGNRCVRSIDYAPAGQFPFSLYCSI